MAFAAPSGVSWTLPLYELALLTAAEIERRDLSVETVVVTPEAPGRGTRDQLVLCGLPRGITSGLLDRIAPGAEVAGFVPKDPYDAGCRIEVSRLRPLG